MANPVSNQEKGYTLNNGSSHTPKSMYSSFRYCHWKLDWVTTLLMQLAGIVKCLASHIAPGQALHMPMLHIHALCVLLIEQAH